MNVKLPFILLILCSILLSSETNFFPHQIGNEWNYVYRKRWIEDTLSIANKHYFIFARNNDIGSKIDTTLYDTLRSDEYGRIWNYENDNEQVWYDFTADSGSIYQVQKKFAGDDYIYKVTVKKYVDINTGFHRFDSCITFTFDSPNIIDEEIEYAFATDIGLVRTASPAWGMSGENLASATINNKYFGKDALFFPNIDTLYINFDFPPPEITTEITDSLFSFDIIYFKSTDWVNTYLSNSEYVYHNLNLLGFLINDSLNQYSYELWYEPINPYSQWDTVSYQIPLDTTVSITGYPHLSGTCNFKLYLLSDNTKIDSLSQPVKIVRWGMAIENEIQTDNFHLAQNYPNPFNPSTTITYTLPKKSHVKISIYDLSGDLVEKLVNDEKYSGTHQVVWNAGDYASGIYIYKIEAGKFMEFRKCLLIK